MHHPKHYAPVVDLASFRPGEHEVIRAVLPWMLHGNEEQRQEAISRITALRTPNELDLCIVLFDELIGYFGELRSSHETQLMEFFALLNHLPIGEKSPWEKILCNQLSTEDQNYPDARKSFQEIQKHIVILDISTSYDIELCRTIRSFSLELSPKLKILAELNTCKLNIHTDPSAMFDSYLELICFCCFHEGPDAGLYVLIQWLINLSWNNYLGYKKALLIRLSTLLKKKRCLNSALVLFEMFRLPEHYIAAPEKYRIFKLLSKHPTEYLNEFQYQELYFFAGNYPIEVSTSFRESILFYQNSNYFLHKCWDRIRSISQFLRQNMDSESFSRLLPYVEERVYQLGIQISMQNNAYVETLHADFAKIEQLYKQVEELSLTDSLTGLRNRRFLQTNIYHMIHLAIRHQVTISYAMIDIDHFKQVNDTYGHNAGDFILKELAGIITKDFRKSDLIVRYGGEEFLMLLFDTGLDQSYRILEEVRISVAKHDFIYRGHKIPITISIGISESQANTPKETDIAEIIAEADKALYEAKNSGRNCIRLAE